MGRARARLPALLKGRLGDRAWAAVQTAVSLAEGRGLDLYLVGGGVRDLLLGAAHLDVDLVVEGDALGLAGAVAERLGARLVTHPRFGTAVVEGDGFRLDLARARSERYERPGALPTVRPASLADDLARRDFTINAIALCLTGARAGELLDPYGGQDDLARRRLRVLHDRSFQDDATRILRAVRYAGRLAFRLDPKTAALLRRDLSYLGTISGARLRHELERIALEERAAQIVRLAARLCVLAAVHPALTPGPRALRALARLAVVTPSHRDAVLFSLLLSGARTGQAESAIERLALTGRQAEAVRSVLALRAAQARLARPGLRPSGAVALLEPHPPPAIEALVLLAERPLAARRARRYLGEWRFVRPRLNGRDVEALGVPRGPRIGAALAALRAARLDGRVKTRDDEVALVRRLRLTQRRRARVGHG